MTEPVTNPRYQPPRAAYVHVPFCRHRCGYCNFTLVAGRDDLIEAYLEAVERELSWLQHPRPVETLYVGGGTPTHLPAPSLQRLLERLRHWFPLQGDYEFSLEANPADLTAEVAAVLARCGVNRISLGVQSLDDDKLRLLERDHRSAQVAAACDLARQTSAQVSLDLIFGVPGESLRTWRRDLAAVRQLAPDHVSTYGLTFERGTRFWSRLVKGHLARVDEALERALYETAVDTLAEAGWQHYEVSSFATPGHRCRHNETYWTGRTYYAAGPGAARFVDGRREVNHRSTTTWLRRVLAGQSPVAEAETLAAEDAAREHFVFGMRRLEGVSRQAFAAETGFEIEALFGAALGRCGRQGLVESDRRGVRLTRAGLLVSDAIWPQLL